MTIDAIARAAALLNTGLTFDELTGRLGIQPSALAPHEIEIRAEAALQRARTH